MKIGFTGTQRGMTDLQNDSFRETLDLLEEKFGKIEEFHHGDCIGADEEAHLIVKDLSDVKIVAHPPSDDRKRAFQKGHRIEQCLPYMARNDKIVASCDILIATPQGLGEVLRSGTWATIRRARKSQKDVYVLYPDGTNEYPWWPSSQWDWIGK